MLRLVALSFLLLNISNPGFAQNQGTGREVNVVDISGGFENNRPVKLSRIAGTIRYIPLETTKETYISKVSKAIFTDDLILVFDEKSNQILRFDKAGRLLGRIGRGGKGPGEYIRVSDIEVNRTSGIIYVFDIGLGKVLKFNLEGKFLGNSKNPLLGFWVTMIDDRYFVYFDPARAVEFAGGYFKVIITDLDGKIIRKYQPQEKSKEEKYKSACSMQSAVYVSDHSAYYWEITSDTVFRVAPDLSFSTHAFIQQGSGSLPKNKMYDADYVMTRFSEHSTIIWLLETENLYFGRGITDFKPAAILYLKNSLECFNVSNDYNYLVNDLDHGPGFWPLGKVNDHCLYSAVNASDLKALSKNANPGSQVKNIASTLNENDNPVLVIVGLK